MFEDDSDQDKRKQSLLSLRTSATVPAEARGGGSILSAIAATNENDPVTRHRLARSRREAMPSPLLAALASMEGFSAEPVAQPKQSRWSWRNLLSPKVELAKPDETVAQPHKPGWFSGKRADVAPVPAQPEPEPAPSDAADRRPRSNRKLPTGSPGEIPTPATVFAEPREIEAAFAGHADPQTG